MLYHIHPYFAFCSQNQTITRSARFTNKTMYVLQNVNVLIYKQDDVCFTECRCFDLQQDDVFLQNVDVLIHKQDDVFLQNVDVLIVLFQMMPKHNNVIK